MVHADVPQRRKGKHPVVASATDDTLATVLCKDGAEPRR